MSFNFTYNYPQVARESGFKLRNYKDGPLDWRLIGSLEVERILRDQSLEQIDCILNHLSEVPLGSILESNILDSGISKYFILSQFSLQYLLFCRKFLEETVTELRDSHGTSKIEIANLKRSLSEANNEIIQLHKKITQMEAIHEVIYPCHLCTKNFVSNDALNLHISRKHNGALERSDNKPESQQPPFKDRESDLTLINTIKLELEIKKLKERLNNAEREIKEKTIESVTHWTLPHNVKATFGKSKQISVQSIGIQSNLTEKKERSENSEDEVSTSSQDRHQLYMLQEKLQEFDKWKEEQKSQNAKFLNEINRKFQELSIALELTRHQRQLELENEKQYSSDSVHDNLEALLNNKLDEICKENAAKLEAVVNKMENDYKVKLEQLEIGMFELNEKSLTKNNTKSNEYPIKSEHSQSQVSTQSNTNKSSQENFNIRENDTVVDFKECIEEIKTPSEHNSNTIKETSLTESNHTFIKHTNETFTEKSKKQQPMGFESYKKSETSYLSDDDTTDISASFLKEDDESKVKDALIATNTVKTQIFKEKRESQKLITATPKIVTIKDAKNITSQRLLSLGVNMGGKSLPTTLKKRISNQLLEKRNKLKQSHPQYYATRNTIKMFVDKLCSTKMPSNTEALLKATKPSKLYNDYQRTDEEKDERITKVVVHQQSITQKPIPMPRKRVVFSKLETQE
ncbi:DAZ interacting zinc finger protein 1 [Cochliomyia hominivorax]